MRAARWRWRWAMVAVTAVAVVSLQGTAWASEGADASVTLQADAGIDGWVAIGHAYPVVVKVTTEQLIQGTVRVELNGMTGTTVLEREIELAGGNSATYRLLAPAEASQWGMGPLGADTGPSTVSLVVDGKVAASTQMDTRMDSTSEVVGVLPDAQAAFGEGAELPGTVPLLVDVGVARPVAVDTELLELGSLALEPLDQLVALPAELNDLSKASRQAVVSWVDSGGVLLLAGDVTALPDNLLPEGWVPPAGGGVRAGLGRVRAVSASWQDEILPSSTRSSSEENQISETMLQAQDSVTGRLSQDAGVRLPPGGRLGVLLALYVLVIGPLAFMALRRFGRRRSGDAAVDDDDEPSTAQVRRPLAAWAAIPVVAVLSTGAVVGAGGSLRRTASSAHMTIYEVGPGGATATTWSLLSNPNHKGAVGVDLPEGWTASTAASMFDQEGSAVHVATTDDGLEATTEPPAGGFGVVRSSGPAADMADALEVTAESVADDVIRGTVRNKLDVPLEDVAVLVGRAAVADLGTLEPGEEREFEVERASQYAFQADPERRVWPDNAGSSGDGVWIGRGGVNGGVIVQKLPDAGVAEVTVDAAAAADRAAGLKEANAAADPAQAPPPVTSPPEPADEAPVEIDVGDGEVTKPGIGVPAAGDQPAPPVPPPVLVPGPGGKPVFPDGPDVGGESDEGSTMMAAWADLMQQKGWNYRPTGQVVVVGWTDELAPPVSASGSGKVARSRSAVVARATAAAAGDHVTDAAIVRSTVRGPDINAGFDDEGFPAMVSFDVPASVDGRPVDPSRLMFHLWGSFTSVEVWTPGGWVGLPEVPDGQFAEVALPEGALVAGQVFVRWTHPLNVPAPGREFVLYEKET